MHMSVVKKRSVTTAGSSGKPLARTGTLGSRYSELHLICVHCFSGLKREDCSASRYAAPSTVRIQTYAHAHTAHTRTSTHTQARTRTRTHKHTVLSHSHFMPCSSECTSRFSQVELALTNRTSMYATRLTTQPLCLCTLMLR